MLKDSASKSDSFCFCDTSHLTADTVIQDSHLVGTRRGPWFCRVWRLTLVFAASLTRSAKHEPCLAYGKTSPIWCSVFCCSATLQFLTVPLSPRRNTDSVRTSSSFSFGQFAALSSSSSYVASAFSCPSVTGGNGTHLFWHVFPNKLEWKSVVWFVA